MTGLPSNARPLAFHPARWISHGYRTSCSCLPGSTPPIPDRVAPGWSTVDSVIRLSGKPAGVARVEGKSRTLACWPDARCLRRCGTLPFAPLSWDRPAGWARTQSDQAASRSKPAPVSSTVGSKLPASSGISPSLPASGLTQVLPGRVCRCVTGSAWSSGVSRNRAPG